MKTVVLEQPGQFKLTKTAMPAAPGPGEALVRVKKVGICGTDLHAYRGRQPFFTYPRILGHELGVEIEALGPPTAALPEIKVGAQCAVEPYLNCGVCIACRNGKPNCCVKLQVLGVHVDGGMRERLLVPAVKLHRSEKLTLEQLALVETLGIGAHAVDRAQIKKDEFTLVIGVGPIGLSVVQFATVAGARVIVMDMNAQRLAFCREQFKVQYTVNASAGDPLKPLSEITNGDLPSVVFDATGNPQSMMQAFNYPAHGGKYILVGLFQGDVTFNDPNFHRREMTLMSSRNATSSDFPRIIKLMEEGKIDTRPWITHRTDPEGMLRDFPEWLKPETGVLKAVVEF